MTEVNTAAAAVDTLGCHGVCRFRYVWCRGPSMVDGRWSIDGSMVEQKKRESVAKCMTWVLSRYEYFHKYSELRGTSFNACVERPRRTFTSVKIPNNFHRWM